MSASSRTTEVFCAAPYFETIYRACALDSGVLATEIRPCCGPSPRQIVPAITEASVASDAANTTRLTALASCCVETPDDMSTYLCRTFRHSLLKYQEKRTVLEPQWGDGRYTDAFIENIEGIESAIANHEPLPVGLVPPILKGTFSTVCNHSCRMCWQRTVPVRKLRQDIVDYIDRHHERLLWVSVSGGEPTHDPDIVALLHRFVDRGYPFVVRLDTNGSEFHAELLERLNLHDVLLTFEAFDAQIYESLGAGRDYDRVYQNVLRYQALSHRLGFGLSLHCIISSANVRHLPAYAARAHELGLSPVYARCNPHTAKDLDVAWGADADALAAVEQTIEFYLNKGLPVQHPLQSVHRRVRQAVQQKGAFAQ